MAERERTKENKYGLNKQQQYFSELYTTDREFFGNGVYSYTKAYDIDQTQKGWYNTAAAGASRLLKDSNILLYINDHLESEALNDVFVDKQIRFLMTQNADFGSKMGAIKEYNALKQRIIKKTENLIEGEISIKVTDDTDQVEDSTK